MIKISLLPRLLSFLTMILLTTALAAQDVKLDNNATLGNILTDVDGNTLYYFTKDAEPDASACTGGCVTNWPVFYKSSPSIGMGLDAADFGSFQRADGAMQTTYKGWPLYYFVNDANAGDTNGEAKNNVWFVAKPDYGIMLMNDVLVGLDGETYTGDYQLGTENVQFFTDAEGRTLYTFKNDKYNQNNFTADDFSNNGVWPVYEEDMQEIPSILDASLFGSITVAGHQQMTYKGWPLYYFGQDAARGETKGVSVPNPGVWPVAVQDAAEASMDVKLAMDATLGNILTDVDGNTLYYFTKDAEPDASACTGGCVTNWPVFYKSSPSIGMGLDAADFGSFQRADGAMQTTYKGWPLYYFVNDANAGDTNGEAKNNVWFVAKPDYGIMLMNDVLVGLDGETYTGDYQLGTENVQFFTDAEGRTLYTFKNDKYNQNNFTADDFSNNGVWPVYEEDMQEIPSILDASLFGSITVAGHQQMTYKGWPLYYFGQDAARGETKGVSVPNPGVWPVAVQDVADAIVAVEEVAGLVELTAYPNPFSGEIMISFDLKTKKELTISLLNSIGQEVKVLNRSFNTGSNRISLEELSNLNEGVYFLKIAGFDKGVSVLSLIKY